MILKEGFADKYLEDYRDGKIKLGLGIDVPSLDHHLRYKQGQFIIINGLDNVGKTAWMLWYFLCLSVKHNLKWCIWSGENKAPQLVRQLIEWRTGQKLKDIPEAKIYAVKAEVLNWFTFIDNTGFYKTQELFSAFKESECDGCLIDPYTGMDREFTHAANYNFLNESRKFVNETGISLYVNTHPNTEAARRVYPNEHDLAGYPMPPSRSQSEGGQPFANRPDDFITIHRLIGHPTHQYETLIYVRKVKDTETGGTPNGIEDPVSFSYNKGLGFTCQDFNPLNNVIKNDYQQGPLNLNTNFDNETYTIPF